MGDKNLHASHAQNGCQSDLGSHIHLQVPHEKNWQKTKDKVRDCGHDTINVGDSDEAVDAPT